MNVNVSSQVAGLSKDFSFTDKDFQMIANLANKRFGLFLQPSKKALVYSRLAKRLRALNLTGFSAYCALLDRPEGAEEQSELLSALTTNVTHFFREVHHFETLRDVIAPMLLAKAETGAPVRLWSSACSAGQEAYCMAAAVLSGAPNLREHDVKILATDIDPNMTAKARLATYPADQREAIPTSWRLLMLDAKALNANAITIKDDIRKLVSFGELNLIEDWPMKRPFDIIFCRNAAIYFDKQTQSRLWSRFADTLCEGGHLMIGHSERLSGPAKSQFKSAGITTYRKCGPGETPNNSNQKEFKS